MQYRNKNKCSDKTETKNKWGIYKGTNRQKVSDVSTVDGISYARWEVCINKVRFKPQMWREEDDS